MVRTKRMSAPSAFATTRKSGGRFVPTPSPGPHSKRSCIPLGLVIRDALDMAETMREVREALNRGVVTVNGIIRKDTKFPVGIFDVVGVVGDHYRAVRAERGFTFINVPKKEADTKLCRIDNKTVVRGKRLQLNLSDGSNILTDKTEYATGDTIALKTPELKIVSHVKRTKGALCVLTGGRNAGKRGVIESVNIVRGTGTNTATLNMEGTSVRVPIDLVFVVGEREPLVKLE